MAILRQVGRSIRPDANGNCKIRRKLETYIPDIRQNWVQGPLVTISATNERHNNTKTSFQNTPRGSKYTAAPNEKWQAKQKKKHVLCPEVMKGLRSSYDVYCKAGHIYFLLFSVNDRTNLFKALFCSLDVNRSPPGILFATWQCTTFLYSKSNPQRAPQEAACSR